MLGAIIQERNQFASSAVVGEGDLTKYDPSFFGTRASLGLAEVKVTANQA
jgi:hypothetical protein